MLDFQSTSTVASPSVTIFHDDVDKFLKSTNSLIKSKQYDLVICDPPKFAPSMKTLSKAEKKYEIERVLLHLFSSCFLMFSSRYIHINYQTMSLVRPGGLLLTCTCSSAVSHQYGLFHKYLNEASRQLGRNVTIIKELGASSDHPINVGFPEGKYFTAYLLRVE